MNSTCDAAWRSSSAGRSVSTASTQMGKLTIRERIDALADPGSFHEIGGLAGYGIYEDGAFQDFTPLPYIGGLARVDGRRVVVGGHDFTISGGAADISTQERFKNLFLADMAREYRVPVDAVPRGRRGQRRGRGRRARPPAKFLRRLPGPTSAPGWRCPWSTASPARRRAASRRTPCWGTSWSLTPQGALFAGGPPLVKRALGATVTKDELGGPDVHVKISGAVDNRATDEYDAIVQMKKFLSYFPDNVYKQPRSGTRTTRPIGRSRSCSRSCRASARAPTTCGAWWS